MFLGVVRAVRLPFSAQHKDIRAHSKCKDICTGGGIFFVLLICCEPSLDLSCLLTRSPHGPLVCSRQHEKQVREKYDERFYQETLRQLIQPLCVCYFDCLSLSAAAACLCITPMRLVKMLLLSEILHNFYDTLGGI
jgi:hypothetical protein